MTPEERQVITNIFERLKAAESQPRDPEAERLIADLVARQPYAPYAMAQSIYVSEQAVNNLGRRVEELGRQLQDAKDEAAKAQAQPQSGGFLSSLFGGAKAAPQPSQGPDAARPAGAPTSPWGAQAYGQAQRGYAPPPQGYAQPGYAPPQQGYPAAAPTPQPGPWGGQPQGGGFLQSAVSTAAGVAGGVLLANALTSAFSHHGGSNYGTFGEPGGQGFLGRPDYEGQGFDGQDFDRQALDRRDFTGQDVGRGDPINHEDAATRGGTDAAYDRSQDYPTHEDAATDHGSGNDAGYSDDPDFSGGDDPGFSGDV